MPYKDPEKQKEAQRDHARRKRAEGREYQQERRRVLRAYIDLEKSKPCVDCNQTFPPYCMDFDHCRGKKKSDVGKMANGMYAVATIAAEIAKCELVCVNCHRKRTFGPAA